MSAGAFVVMGPSWMPSGTDVTMPLMSPPKKNWYRYWSAIDRPIVTIICCIVPTRLRRSGPQMNWSCNRPVRPPMTTANTAETMTGICNICVPAYAMRPPSVTCSPWENELSPVVP